MRQLLILFALSGAHTSTKQQREIGGAGQSLVGCAPLISATLEEAGKLAPVVLPQIALPSGTGPVSYT